MKVNDIADNDSKFSWKLARSGLDVFNLLFTPIPHLLPQLGIKRLTIWKCDPCPGGEIL
jgi:hypothetical protein